MPLIPANFSHVKSDFFARHTITAIAHRSRQSGLGMIEVLVAGLIFALGVLGLSSMQLKAKGANYDALQRSLATSLARDMAARMRSNPTALIKYGSISFLGGVNSSPPATDCKAVTCTPDQLALYDLWEWEQALMGAAEKDGSENTGGLPSPSGCIDAIDGEVVISVAWEGLSDIGNDVTSDCGKDRGIYGDQNKKRKLVILKTFIEGI